MHKRIILAIFAIIVCIVSVGAVKKNPINSKIDFEGQGFEKMKTTAYCMGHHTANGSAVHEGGCACSPDHIGDVAIVYTLGGEFIGYLECNDTAGPDSAVTAGKVLDVYKPTLDMCQDYMEMVGESQSVWVMWVKGDG
ncbi:MAG: hypothetical protein IKT30_06600 [Bacteroidaceae bacterium]|nr:hypothetical protein [Bacteroidaceae bacterium]